MITSIEEGRKEDGNRSIADKIIKRLHDLQKTVQNNYGRWAWELLQNAKDSVAETNRRVNVQIVYSGDSVRFSHDGNHFTEKDIRGLINQISSKEVEEGQTATRTGRFGTGFLTTHLLSKTVFIEGTIETIGKEYFRFGFLLDRNEKTTQPLTEKIESAWKEFHASTEKGKIDGYEKELFKTSFTYPLNTDKQKEIARIGIDEFSNLIPYVLVFNDTIESIEIINRAANETTRFINQETESKHIRKLTKVHNDIPIVIKLLFASNETVSIAAEVSLINGFYEVRNFVNVPKLFCDFPLIGSENFHFPIVVNSFYFNPLTERDGIWLQGDNDPEVEGNKDLLCQGLNLYKSLMEAIDPNQFKNLFHLANTQMPATEEKYLDAKWYAQSIQAPLRTWLIDKPIVEMQDGTRGKLSELWFPLKSYSKEVKERLWQYTADLYPMSVCNKKFLQEWLAVVWGDKNKITFSEILSDIAKEKSIEKLSTHFENNIRLTFNWLNGVAAYIMEDESNLYLFDNHAVLPNNHGDFIPKSKLFINQIRDTKLIEILALLGKDDDWNDILLHPQVTTGKYVVKKLTDIANKINEKLKATINRTATFNKAITLLSEWFDNNSEKGKELFGETYRRRAELFMNTIEDKDSLYKVMRSTTNLSYLSEVAAAIQENPRLLENVEQAKEISTLLKQYNITDISGLRTLLENQEQLSALTTILPDTLEFLTSGGITSLKEWEEAKKDQDFATLFSHQSIPTVDMFLRAQKLIKQAKEAIVAYLKTLDNYNLDGMGDSTAPTIIGGILKDDRPISIVTRPAYDQKVIIYYTSELDILDFETSELWVDDGVLPKVITLGYLLKKARIVKFPI